MFEYVSFIQSNDSEIEFMVFNTSVILFTPVVTSRVLLQFPSSSCRLVLEWQCLRSSLLSSWVSTTTQLTSSRAASTTALTTGPTFVLVSFCISNMGINHVHSRYVGRILFVGNASNLSLFRVSTSSMEEAACENDVILSLDVIQTRLGFAVYEHKV